MKAAFEIIDLNPPLHFKMAGFSERNHGAEGIHDAITASAFVLDDGVNKAAIVSLDCIGVDSVLTQEVAKRVEQASTIKKENILIGAIHTHSSIDATRIHGVQVKINHIEYNEQQKAFYYDLIDKLAELILTADRHLTEAKIGYGTAVCTGLGTNRNDPLAYYNEQVYIVKAEDLNGNCIGVLVNHACHPTVLNHHNYLYTADYVGAFRQQMAEVVGENKVMYLQGAAGSASCRYTRKESSFDEAKRLSKFLVEAVAEKLDQIEMTDTLSINGKKIELTLPVKDYGSEEEILAQIADYQARLKQMKENNEKESELRKMYVTLQGAERNLTAKRNNTFKEITSELQYLNCGLFAIMAFPADMFGEIGRDGCALSSVPCFAAGYANDSIGYIVSKEGYKMDCYEKNLSYFDERAHDLIVAKCQQLVK